MKASQFFSLYASRPGPGLLEVWGEYVVSIASRLDASGKELLETEILGRARRVAEAAGGILGLVGKVSAQEQAVLERLKHPFA